MIHASTNADYPPQGWPTALARLWLLRPVRSIPSGNPLRAVLIMGLAWLSAWVAIDRLQSQPDPQFFPGGIPLLAWYVLAILGLAALLRWWARPAPAAGPALVLAMGVVPVALLFTSVVPAYLDPALFLGGGLVVAVYTLLYLARGLHAMTGYTQRAAAFAGLVFIAGFSWLTDTLDVI